MRSRGVGGFIRPAGRSSCPETGVAEGTLGNWLNKFRKADGGMEADLTISEQPRLLSGISAVYLQVLSRNERRVVRE